ncbi:MAG: sugar-specific transcriptional regulator TrmB [Methanomicrobiales archaeon]|nr:sugar-specific transcriptional regulator TrmB [Methanomicrobiales archaeon]
MTGVLAKRREYLRLMRQCTLDSGSFTVTEIAERIDLPRSTVQDWINRLVSEQCITVVAEKRGRHPARYAAISALPESACRRIFTTVDQDQVEMYHECLSRSCAAFCEHHHRRSQGVLTYVSRDGTLLRERAKIGEAEADIGLPPRTSVGVIGVQRNQDETITQRIRCVGGPAYSLTDMMTRAEGVCSVKPRKIGPLVEGEVTTRALTYLAIGIDDTDSQEAGATFALSLALLQHLSTTRGVYPIGHQVVMLFPTLSKKTAGNAATFIELAAEPSRVEEIRNRSQLFIADESYSSEWGMAMKTGFLVSDHLRSFSARTRSGPVEREDAMQVASDESVYITGGRGIIGALAAIACIGIDSTILLDPKREIGNGETLQERENLPELR